MKKIFAAAISALLVLMCLTVFVCAEELNPVTVTLNGEVVDCASYGQDATIVEGRTLVPLRAIFEALGASVEWDGETRTVTSVLGETEIKLTIGENVLYKNEEAVELDVPAMIMNGRTLVPARAVAESFGVKVEWDSQSRTVVLSKEKEPDESENTRELAHAYGDFYFGMSMEEAKTAAKGETLELKHNSSFETEMTILCITDENNEFDDEDWLITGNYNCQEIELSFKSDILYSVNIKIEHQEKLEDALKVYDKMADYYNADKEIKNVIQKQWLKGQENEVDSAALFEDDKLIEFPKKVEKFDSVGCFLNEKKDDKYQPIGYYTSFEVTNLWYYQYAKLQEKEPEFADLLVKLPLGATKQQTMGVFKGDIKDNGNRVDIFDVEDERRYVNDPTHRYYAEKDIYGQGFDCNYISLEYDDAGLDKFYARTEEYNFDEATYALNVVLNLYGGYDTVFHENKNAYEWKNYKYRAYDGTNKTASIFAGIVTVDDGKYYCFVSAQQVKEERYFTIDAEGRIVGTDYPHAYGKLYFGMTMQQASEAIEGEKEENGALYRIDAYDKENAFDDEDANITGGMDFERISVLFDSKNKTLCRVEAYGFEISQEQVEAALEALCKYYGEEDEAKEGPDGMSYSWTLRGKNALVNFAVTEVADDQYACSYSITLAGSSFFET